MTSEFTGNKDNNNIKAALSPIFFRFQMSGFMNMCVYVCVQVLFAPYIPPSST